MKERQPAKTRHRSSMKLGLTQFAVLAAGVGALLAVPAVVLWPVDTESVVLPKYEAQFGFSGGRVKVRDSRGEAVDVYALLTVEQGGLLGRAGFEPGDVPVEYHGGVGWFEWALHRSECGHDTPVSAIRAAEWEKQELRRLIVPSSPQESPLYECSE